MTHDDPAVPAMRWTKERVARLGFLLGQGFDAKAIADDPIVASTPSNVHRHVQRFGLTFRHPTLRLPAEVAARFDRAAYKRGRSREWLLRELLIVAGSDEGLIDNILDDGC